MDDLSDRTDFVDGRHEDEDGDVFWMRRGNYHRLDGPAVTWLDGEQWWMVNGKKHRIDGPAIEWYSSDRWWWFLNGVNYSFANWLSVNTEISAEHKVMLKLKYG